MEWTTDKRIVAVAPCGDGQLAMDWNDGTRRVFDMRPRMQWPAFERLADPAYFRKVFLAGHGATVMWPRGEDCAPETLYEQSDLLDPSEPLPPKDPSLTWDEGKKVTEVAPMDNGMLLLRWNDGTRRVFDAWAGSDFVEKLLDPAYYRQVAVRPDKGGIVWPDGQGFPVKTMYENAPRVEDAGVPA